MLHMVIRKPRLPNHRNHGASNMSFGRYYEEFEVGQVFKHWPGRTISEADDTWFSLLTMNQNPLHIDAHYASKL